MNLVPVKKVTIIAENLLKDEIIDLVKAKGATGYTLAMVRGEGTRGVNATDWEGRHVQIVTLVSDSVCEQIVQGLSNEYFEDYAVVTWVSEVNVLRGEKFLT